MPIPQMPRGQLLWDNLVPGMYPGAPFDEPINQCADSLPSPQCPEFAAQPSEELHPDLTHVKGKTADRVNKL